MRVEDMLAHAALNVPDKSALVCGDRRITYAQLDAQAANLAAALILNGASAGDRIAIVADNSIESAIAFFATLRTGAVAAPLHPASKLPTLTSVSHSIQPSIVLTGARQLATVREALAGVASAPALIVIGANGDQPGALDICPMLAGDQRHLLPHATRGPDDIAVLIHTSGSTGRPKGVMLTHRAMLAALDAVIERLGAREQDVILSALPFAFSYGLHQLLMAARTRGTLVIENSFAFPQLIFDRIRAENVTALPLVPTTIATLLAQPGFNAAALPSLRYVTSASAPLAPERAAKLAERLPGVDIHIMYGQSECKRISMLPPDRLSDKAGSVGLPIPGTEAFVADAEGHPLPTGEIGELVVRGPHLMCGYWRDPEATAAALRPDPSRDQALLFTGDLFRTDAEGFLHFVARKDDIIKTRGEKVAPAEVEAALVAVPGVREALVFARTDAVLGQAVHALVVVDDPRLVERDLQRACARVLEDFKVPRSISIRADLPRTDNGKASRRLAAEMHS